MNEATDKFENFEKNKDYLVVAPTSGNLDVGGCSSCVFQDLPNKGNDTGTLLTNGDLKVTKTYTFHSVI